MMARVRVVKPGMLTTVQDLGRWGLQARGVPVAGPMDPVSHRIANALVGNPPDRATLETTLIGPELQFEDARWVVVTGGRFEATLDGARVEPCSPVLTHAGSILKLGARRAGARAYIGIGGGVATVPVLGSRATHVLSGMGGHEGRALRAGDVLPLGSAPPFVPRLAATRAAVAVAETPATRPATIRVLPGPQAERFAETALDMLQSGPYVVGDQSDRMGFRLQGPRLAHRGSADIISDATPLGVLQVPASGQPILLMADRQTAGGYPKLATVVTADIAVAGQLAAGDALTFVVCSLRDALAALIGQERALMSIEASAARAGDAAR